MKKKLTVITVLCVTAGILWLECSAQKRKSNAYEFPNEMAPAVQAEFVKLCDKGRVLYDLNCAKCHNTVVKGKQVIPDFTQGQIKGYEIRVSNVRHEQEIPEENVTAEELGLISTFLIYKKRNEK